MSLEKSLDMSYKSIEITSSMSKPCIDIPPAYSRNNDRKYKIIEDILNLVEELTPNKIDRQKYAQLIFNDKRSNKLVEYEKRLIDDSTPDPERTIYGIRYQQVIDEIKNEIINNKYDSRN